MSWVNGGAWKPAPLYKLITEWVDVLQSLQQQQALPPVPSLSNLSGSTVPVAALLPHLQNALNHAVMQQVIFQTLKYIIMKMSFLQLSILRSFLLQRQSYLVTLAEQNSTIWAVISVGLKCEPIPVLARFWSLRRRMSQVLESRIAPIDNLCSESETLQQIHFPPNGWLIDCSLL